MTEDTAAETVSITELPLEKVLCHPNPAPRTTPLKLEEQSTQSHPTSLVEDLKIEGILKACKAQDFGALVTYAVSKYGFVSDNIRRHAWPILLGSHGLRGSPDDVAEASTWRLLPEHRDERQVALDVDRSFIFYPRNPSTSELDRRKKELSDLITEVLRRQPYLCYFQGYHDICQVLLLVLGHDDAGLAVTRLSVLRIRDYMLPSLSPALAHLQLLPGLLHTVDRRLYTHLSQTQPFFALAATLTLYAHEIQEYGEIARLFDVLLAREAVFSIYLFAEASSGRFRPERIVLMRKEELFEIPPDEPEMLHSVLCKLPKPLDLEELISQAVALFERHPPESLRSWRGISRFSTLKTARSAEQAAKQTLDEGAQCFQQHADQLRRQTMRKQVYNQLWRYRGPIGTAGLAICIGLVSWWLRSSPSIKPGVLHDGGFQHFLRKLGSFWIGHGRR
ncbi:MAG: hypothetical protein M1817_003296 [Caeruleum heppii]|nr:MAG: hypothetical protein M1817_003296 [Caeruleum heppii]